MKISCSSLIKTYNLDLMLSTFNVVHRYSTIPGINYIVLMMNNINVSAKIPL